MAAKLKKVNVAEVHLWGGMAGAVSWDDEREIGSFEYAPDFIKKGLNIAPVVMPLAERQIYSFPELPRPAFHGLPGLLADSLPDRFGNAVIDAWLQRQGRDVRGFSPVERLCYIGSRGMGALEFKPALVRPARKAQPLEIGELTRLAAEILRDREKLKANLGKDKEEALKAIFRVGTSAGGARAKAIIAWNRGTDEVRSGQIAPPPGFEPWLLKFDGVNDAALGDPQGFGRVEFAYHLMAAAAGVEMTECRLLHEGGRSHFMTRRFDRTPDGGKIHMLSLCGKGHLDFNAPGAHGYEAAFSIILRLNLGYPSMEQMFRRMVFNAIARNQDDHTRNIAFLMDRDGRWRLAPAFDIIWSYNPEGEWTNRHQMTINGKRGGFEKADLLAVAEAYGIKKAGEIIAAVGEAVARWPKFAAEAGVDAALLKAIQQSHRLKLARGK